MTFTTISATQIVLCRRPLSRHPLFRFLSPRWPVQVKPYYFDFKCHVKRRWEGRTAVEVFAAEFPARTLAYYADAMAAGRLRIEGQSARADMPLRSGMCMRHFIHRHEPPVPAGDIQACSAACCLLDIVPGSQGAPSDHSCSVATKFCTACGVGDAGMCSVQLVVELPNHYLPSLMQLHPDTITTTIR